MISKLLNNEASNAALVVALSGTIVALVASGPGRVSLGRVLSGALSNPVPRREPSGVRVLSTPALEEKTAA